MKLADLFPKKYMSAADLNGQPMKLRVRCVKMCKMRNPTDEFDARGKRIYEDVQKPVVMCHDQLLGIVLNKTRAEELGQALNIEDTDQAAGRWIVAYPVGNQIHIKSAPSVDQNTGEIRAVVPSAKMRANYSELFAVAEAHGLNPEPVDTFRTAEQLADAGRALRAQIEKIMGPTDATNPTD